jgi:hypothetical protein
MNPEFPVLTLVMTPVSLESHVTMVVLDVESYCRVPVLPSLSVYVSVYEAPAVVGEPPGAY